MNILYCKKCLFPNTKPDLFFDSEGICDACKSAERKHGIEDAIDWEQRDKSFKEIISDARSKSRGWYDCVIPVSGGKDSTWQVYAMKVIHGMRPLAVTFDQFDQTNTGLHNLEVLKEIGVDHVHFTLNPKIVRALVRKGFEIVGDHYWVNHVGIYTVPFHVAAKFNIPLVIFGENPQFEYGGPTQSRDSMIIDRRWRQEFGLMRGFREEDMVDEEISMEDLCMLQFPSDEDIQKLGILGLFYGYFYKWDASVHLQVVKKLGWQALVEPPQGAWVDYENCDMKYIDIRERVKFLKFGYGRATDQLNIEIRNNRISRSEALEIAKNIDGGVDSDNVKEFCDLIGISLEKYEKIMDSFVNHDLFEKDSKGEWVLIRDRT
ncbi:MAG: N-acetyl sugar amidotransferase [Gammaproteobacteria bacterium]|nr:N-acetyl sugar amidotransferase [Gammaproteobacteria bacterium]MDH5801225.1 N-acetyl sugar amidotransferase [Gammaproteobacteria bacterium]